MLSSWFLEEKKVFSSWALFLGGRRKENIYTNNAMRFCHPIISHSIIKNKYTSSFQNYCLSFSVSHAHTYIRNIHLLLLLLSLVVYRPAVTMVSPCGAHALKYVCSCHFHSLDIHRLLYQVFFHFYIFTYIILLYNHVLNA